ncbi:hypothetical protein PHYSODRAFT_523096, partial [Phytophthora sojae]
SHRLLRTHHRVVEDEEDSSEERTLSQSQVKSILDEMGLSWTKYLKNPNYLLRHKRYEEYRQLANKIIDGQKPHGPPKITYEHHHYG